MERCQCLKGSVLAPQLYAVLGEVLQLASPQVDVRVCSSDKQCSLPPNTVLRASRSWLLAWCELGCCCEAVVHEGLVQVLREVLQGSLACSRAQVSGAAKVRCRAASYCTTSTRCIQTTASLPVTIACTKKPNEANIARRPFLICRTERRENIRAAARTCQGLRRPMPHLLHLQLCKGLCKQQTSVAASRQAAS